MTTPTLGGPKNCSTCGTLQPYLHLIMMFPNGKPQWNCVDCASVVALGELNRICELAAAIRAGAQ